MGKPKRFSLNQFSQVQSNMPTTQSRLNSVPRGGGGNVKKTMKNHFCSVKSSVNFTVYRTKREADLVFASKPEGNSLNQFSQVESKHEDNVIAH